MSDLRRYVITLFQDDSAYNTKEVMEIVDANYGKDVYTKKQIRNLLYNLTRVHILTKRKDNKYIKYMVEKMDIENEENGNLEFCLNDYISQIQYMTILVKRELNKNNFLERYKEIDLNLLSKLYQINEEINKSINEIRKCTDAGTGEKKADFMRYCKGFLQIFPRSYRAGTVY